MEPTDHDLAAICATAAEAADEMLRQLHRWGHQHYPSIDPTLVGDPDGAAAHYDLPTEDVARDRCDHRHKVDGTGTWADILVEEVAETIHSAATRTSAETRVELIQVAAVALSWAQDLAETAEADHSDD